VIGSESILIFLSQNRTHFLHFVVISKQQLLRNGYIYKKGKLCHVQKAASLELADCRRY